MYTIQEQRALLSQKNKVGYIYVYSGFNVYLQKVSVNDTNISIEELAFICIKSGKGMFINENDLAKEDIQEYDQSDIYIYCDMSSFGLNNGYLLIENMQVDKNIELYS